jgi:alpha-glucosidase (family GH31 glycosyl hydrolase)
MQLRHAFIPYLYTMAWQAHRTGLAPLLPMYYDDVSAPAFACPDQYRFGSELVAAPVLTPARPRDGRARSRVWLPADGWTSFFTGKTFRAGWHLLLAELEDIPVFAKPGAIVPLGPRVGWGGVGNPEELDVYIFPGASNRFELYEDDGETNGYQRGEYALTPFTLEQAGNTLTFAIHPVEGQASLVPARRTYRVHLRGVDEAAACPGTATYDPATRTLTLEAVTLAPSEGFTVKFSLPAR